MTNDAAGGAPANLVTIEYELTRDEVVFAVRWQLSHVYRIRRLLVADCLLIAVGAFFILTRHWVYSFNDFVGSVVIGMGLFALLLTVVTYYLQPRRAWHNIAADGPRTMEFTDEFVHVRTMNTDVTNRWSMYSKALEMQQMYLLRTRKNESTCVPKRAFRSSFDEVTFRGLAAKHIAIEHQGPFR